MLSQKKVTNMKELFRNVNDYKKKLTEGNVKFDARDYPFFCVILGYLLNKVDDFNLLYNTLSEGLELVVNDKFPEPEYFQWLLFLDQNPHRIDDCKAFIETLKRDDTIDVFDEIEALYNSESYKKKSLKESNRCVSIDTVVMQSLSPQREYQHQEKQELLNYFDDNHSNNIEEKAPYMMDEYDYQLIKKMQEEDEEMARKLQEEEENIMKQYKPKRDEEETMCEICYVGLYDGNPSFLDNCGHGFHQECLIESFKMQISGNNFPLKCPNEECKEDCLERDIKEILPIELFNKYQEHTLKAYADMHGDSVSWCPTADCGYMFFYEKGDDVRFQCLECKKEYCLNCRCDWHKDMTCAEYKVSTTVSEDDKKFLDFVKGKKFKQCPKCKFWVEKNLGCDHMTCKCKFEFCYKCGGVFMKCECVEKAREEHERRFKAREESQRRKKELTEKRLRERQEKEERIARGEEPPKRTRSKKQSKK